MRFLSRDISHVSRIAAAFSLIQGVIWIIISIIGVLLYRCDITVASSGRTSYLVYLVYFYNVKCDNAPEFLRLLQKGWPLEAVESAERTRGFTAAVLAFNLLWVLTSTVLLLSTCAIPCIQRRKIYYIFSWISSTICILILDIVGASLYGYDFIKTSTPDGLLQLLGVSVVDHKGWESLMPTRYHEFPAVPTGVLLPLASRLFPLLWIINLIFVIKVIQLAREQELRSRDGYGSVTRLSNPLYRQSRWQDEAAKQFPTPNPEEPVQQEMQQLNDDFPGETSQLNSHYPYQVLDFQEQNIHEGEPKTTSESEGERKETDVDDNEHQDTVTNGQPQDTSNSQAVRSSVVSRLSNLSHAPQGLQNQLPWSYLGRTSSSSNTQLNRTSSSVKTNDIA